MKVPPARRIAVARARATALEEKARENPSQAPKLTELARKLRVGAQMMENLTSPQRPETVSGS